MEFISDKRPIIRFFLTIIIVVWAFCTLNAGFYVDENGLLTIYKGIYQGQHMFVDSWESLQTGGVLAWPALALYYKVLSPLFIANGINVGLVLYMRILYVITRGLIALYLYYTIKNTSYNAGAFYSALFYFMFVVAWRNFSYKSYCEMAIMLMICFLIRYHETEKNIFIVLTAIACCVGILAYPTMILYAVVIGILIIVEMYHGHIGFKPLIAFVCTCVIIGGAFVIYLQCTTGIPEIINQLQFLGDQDYEHGMLYRLGMMLVSYIALGVIAYIPVVGIIIIRKFRYLSDVAEGIILSLYWLAFMLGICLAKFDSISNSRFVYALVIIFFWFPYYVHEEKEDNYTKIGAYNSSISDEKGILWLIFILTIAAKLVWSISTNQGIEVPGTMSVYTVIAVILIISKDDKYTRLLIDFILVVAAFFMGFWVPEKNGGYSDVTEERWIVTEGELKGIALLPEDYEKNLAVYNLVSQYVGEDDYLLVAFGSNSTGYLNSVAKQGTYSVYARTQKNGKLIEFYEQNPEAQADYVLIDTSNSKYDDFVNGEVGEFIYSNYVNTVASEGDFVLLGK